MFLHGFLFRAVFFRPPRSGGFKPSLGRGIPLRAKHKTMKQHGSFETAEFILPPAYPFTAKTFFADLHRQLELERKRIVTFKEIARILGRSKSTAHYWFEIYDHPQIRALMLLLESLSPGNRLDFVEAHCRAKPRLSESIVNRDVVNQLVEKPAGLTIVTGGSDWARTRIVTALGHDWSSLHWRRTPPTGIDLHRPTDFVPVPMVRYLDPAIKRDQIRTLSLSVLPRLVTSRSRLLLFNGVWSRVPEIHQNLLRSAAIKHIVLAEAIVPPPQELATTSALAIDVLTVEVNDSRKAAARVEWQRVA